MVRHSNLEMQLQTQVFDILFQLSWLRSYLNRITEDNYSGTLTLTSLGAAFLAEIDLSTPAIDERQISWAAGYGFND